MFLVNKLSISIKVGVLNDSYQSHKADILSVSLNPKQDLVISTGVDSTFAHFQPVVNHKRRKWVKSIHRNNVHSHDVRSVLFLSDRTLISAGIDASLAVADLSSKVTHFYPPIPFGKPAVLAPEARILGLRYSSHLELWKLGAAAAEKEVNLIPDSILTPISEPVKLLKLGAKDEEKIRTFALSENAYFLAFATCTRLRIYSLGRNVTSVKKVKVEAEVKISHHLCFYGNDQLISVTESGDLQCFSLTSEVEDGESKAILSSSVELNRKSGIFTATLNGDLLALADFSGAVLTVDLIKKEVCRELPSYESAPIAAMDFLNPARLMIIYSDHKVVVCCPKSGKFLEELSESLPKMWHAKKSMTRGAIPDPGDESRIMIYDDESICVAEKDEVKSSSKAPKKVTSNRCCYKAVFKKRYRHLVHFESIKEEKSLVAIEVRQDLFDEQMPPSLKVKKFGAM